MSADQSSALPSWFCHPLSVTTWQRCLFTSRFEDVLVRLQISADDVVRWHAKGWLSFDGQNITEVDDFNDPREWELIVVRDIVRSGLSDAQIESVFSRLPKPYALDPSRLVFSFRHGWVAAVPPQEPDPDEIIAENLDSWLEDCDEDRLRQLQIRIDGLLNALSDRDTENTK